MTTLDDIQDAAVTASVVGRVAARFFPKVIPFVGAISTVADILNLGSLTCMGGLGFVNWDCKKGLEDAGRHTQQTYRKRLAEQTRTGKFRVGWGEIFQILQTTANLVDVGLEIGAGLGYAVDLFFGLLRGGDITLPCWVSIPAEAVLRIPDILTEPCGDATLAAAVGAPGWETGQYHFQTIGALGHLDKAFGLPIGTSDQKIQAGSSWLIDAAKRAWMAMP
ncbi:MAG: hypothetical protein WAP47_03515, partial [Candidatus Rokuibacteriota bacterium]